MLVPNLVTLRYARASRACRGLAVGEHTVLTAAHCVTQAWPVEIVTSDAHPHKVRAVVVADGFDARSFANDLAVIAVDSSLVVANGGAPSRPSWPAAVDAHKGEIVYFAHGREIMGGRVEDSTTLGVRLAAAKQPCAGDSGGPVWRRLADGSEALIGVVSHGDLECVGGAVVQRVTFETGHAETWSTTSVLLVALWHVWRRARRARPV